MLDWKDKFLKKHFLSNITKENIIEVIKQWVDNTNDYFDKEGFTKVTIEFNGNNIVISNFKSFIRFGFQDEPIKYFSFELYESEHGYSNRVVLKEFLHNEYQMQFDNESDKNKTIHSFDVETVDEIMKYLLVGE